MTKKMLIPGIFAIVSLLSWINLLPAQINRSDDPDLQKIDITEHYGETIPLDLSFLDEDSNAVTLADYFHHNKPVILVLAYYECPMLCTFVLNGTAEAVRTAGLQFGQDYRIVTVSIDPKEGPHLAALKKKTYLEQVRPQAPDSGWVFLTGKEDQIERLTTAIGFEYYYVPDRDEYAHPALITLLTAEGRISRYLYGIEFNPRDLKLGLLEASKGNIGSTVDRLLLYCFHYDPDSKGYVLFAANVMKLGGVFTLGLLGFFLTGFWIKEKKTKKKVG